MTRREVQQARRMLLKAGWADIRGRIEGDSYALTAVDPSTGYEAGPWWNVEDVRERCYGGCD